MTATIDGDEIAARASAILNRPVRASRPLKGGLTNISWLAEVEGMAVVVRLSHADEHDLQIDREHECRVLRAVAAAGIAPAVLACVPDRHVLVTRYLDGDLWDEATVRVPANIERVASLLKRLHAVTVDRSFHILDLPANIERYWATLARMGRDRPAADLAARDILKMAGAFANGARRCLCHNDVHHLNLVDTGRLWLLDWEYAAVGDPFFDLASVCCYHSYDAAARECLVQAYRGRVDAAAITRLELACWVFDYVRKLWMAVRAGMLA